MEKKIKILDLANEIFEKTAELKEMIAEFEELPDSTTNHD